AAYCEVSWRESLLAAFQTGGWDGRSGEVARRDEESRLRLHIWCEAPELGNLGADSARVVFLPHGGGHAGFEAQNVRGGQPLGVGAFGRKERGTREAGG